MAGKRVLTLRCVNSLQSTPARHLSSAQSGQAERRPQACRHGTQHDRPTRAERPKQVETQGHQSGPAGLPDQPRQGHHAAGATGAVGRGTGHDGAQVRRLEQTKPQPAQRHAQHHQAE